MVQNHTGYKDLLVQYIQDVFSQEKMSGRHSMKKRTISGLEIIDIDTKDLLVIKGSIW
jgi:ribosomal protein L3